MQGTSKFRALTTLEAVNLFRGLGHAQFDKIMLYLSMDSEITPGSGMSVENKANKLAKFAKENPSRQTVSDETLEESIIKQAAKLASPHGDMAFVGALALDGYTLTDEGSIIRDLPPVADLPAANDELYSLLEELGLAVAKGHLDQAIKNHAEGYWAAANSQLRTFFEELFNEISRRIEPARAKDRLSSENRRTLLGKTSPPFLSESLGEWSGDGKNFVNGIFKRLHSEGSHPGLSGDEDCTFRLHLALIVGRHYLRRERNRLITYPAGG
jgi:hypothetical protein